MNIGKLFSSDNSGRLRKEADDTRKAIETAPAGDVFISHGEHQLMKPQGDIWRGQASGQDMSAVKVSQNSTVVLHEKIVKEDNRGLQVAAGIAGTLIGAALFGGKKKDSLGAALGGLLLGGLAAWGAGKATDAVKEKRIERVETTPEGITHEQLSERQGDETSYTNNFRRTGPAPKVDPEAVKDYINKLEI